VLIQHTKQQGYPTAWCLSTSENESVLNVFFLEMRKKTGQLQPNWMMTDDANQFYNSWKFAYGGDPNKLLCIWHIDRAWKKAIHSKVDDKEVQCQVYHTKNIID
jgi:hypothetical protein